jgi:hypothetical protein
MIRLIISILNILMLLMSAPVGEIGILREVALKPSSSYFITERE